MVNPEEVVDYTQLLLLLQISKIIIYTKINYFYSINCVTIVDFKFPSELCWNENRTWSIQEEEVL